MSLQRNSINDTYSPAEDTYFIADNIADEYGDSALDVGSGSGFLTKLLEKKFKLVVGTDVNFAALQNPTFKAKNLICCSGGDALKIKFDFIVCNLPYLATENILDAATDGGKEGFEIPKQIFDSVFPLINDGGKFVFVTSSLSNYQKLIDYAQNYGLKSEIIAKKKLFFEELILISAINNS